MKMKLFLVFITLVFSKKNCFIEPDNQCPDLAERLTNFMMIPILDKNLKGKVLTYNLTRDGDVDYNKCEYQRNCKPKKGEEYKCINNLKCKPLNGCSKSFTLRNIGCNIFTLIIRNKCLNNNK